MIIKSLIFINVFSVVIGILLIILERIIASYGEVTITMNEDKEFRASGGQSLLRILFENKYFIPSACGGKGTCGYCKLVVKEGGGDVLPTEALILSPAETRQGFRLSCQVKVRGDMKIEVPPEYLEIQEYEGEIVSTELVTSDIRKIRFQITGDETIKFRPGQYVQIKLDNDGTTDYRAYSIASNPDDDNHIELNVKLIPEGLGSEYMHSLKEGDPVFFSGPYGDFFLDADSGRRIICVAGGVGLAPIKSIVEYWKSHAMDREIEIYYGCRTRKDLYYHDVFEKMETENPNFHYYPALSEEDPEWKGARGFIHSLMEKHLGEGEHSEAYLCGPPIMIEAVMEVLKEKGVPEERVLFDKF
ncbi:MAG: 2Fe-2S iron-sulfur cluster binding domain-containing protein [Bacteroidales bacterium]|nr:2Fe-2S iron-sulfur cluster binding domain-containing protein [Candidatus Latescibacterota bacterium]